MALLTSLGKIAEVVKMETPFRYGREKLTIKQDGAASAALKVGELLENDSGYVVVATGANCAAILLEPVTAATLIAGSSTAVCLVRGPAVIDSDNVTVDSGQKAAALAALLVLGIVSRVQPTKYTEGTPTS